MNQSDVERDLEQKHIERMTAEKSDNNGRYHRFNSIVIKLLWAASLICDMIGIVVTVSGLHEAQSAPQQAAAVAIGLAWTVIPYSIARAMKELAE